MGAAETIFAFLTRDHERLERLLAQATGAGAIDLAPYRAFRGGMLRHIAIEERVLLPELAKLRGEKPHPLAAQLCLEHAAITSLLVPTPSPDIVQALRAVME